ncbi:MAG: hypothetical protein FP824_10425 [Euryarchaeota archaeon]|nr:hypothetical protein [Euryarchaeota archaeon]
MGDKFDLIKKKYHWLKPRILPITIVIIIWICLALIQIVPVTMVQYRDDIEIYRETYYASFFDVASDGFQWKLYIDTYGIPNEFVHTANIIISGLIILSIIPLYVFICWLTNKKGKSNLPE